MFSINLSLVVQSRVVFSTVAVAHEFVANMPKFGAQEAHTVFVGLFWADFHVEPLANVLRHLRFLLRGLLVCLAALGGGEEGQPLPLPVGPYMGHLVGADEGLLVVPLLGVAPQNVIGEFHQDSRPFCVAAQIRL